MFDFTRIAIALLIAVGACWTPGVNAATDDAYGPTGPNDTLWSIANRMRPEGATVEQTMLALTRINPDAFVGPQGNLVMAGAKLRAPTLAEAQAISAARATEIVADPEVHWAKALAVPAIAEDKAQPADVDDPGIAPAGAEDQGIAPSAPPIQSPALPADQGASVWQARAEDAESRVVELGQVRDDLQSRLDEQVAIATDAEQRITQLEAQLANQRSTASSRGRDARSPLVLWGGMSVVGILLFIGGFVFGRQRGAAWAVTEGAAPKAQLGPRAMSAAATVVAADAPDAARMSSDAGGEPTQPGRAQLPPHEPSAEEGVSAPDGGGDMTTYASFSAIRLGQRAADVMRDADQDAMSDAGSQAVPLGADAGDGHDAGWSASDAGGLNEPDWQDRPTGVEAADADLEAPGAEVGDEGLTAAGDVQPPWVDRAAPHVADEPTQPAPSPPLGEDATGTLDPDWLETPGGIEAADTHRVMPGPNMGRDDASSADDLDATWEPKPNYSATTKLNLARAYADLGDYENARDVCLEVIRDGNDAEREAAEALLERLDEQAD